MRDEWILVRVFMLRDAEDTWMVTTVVGKMKRWPVPRATVTKSPSASLTVAKVTAT
jgi:hypothetical protein